MLFTVNMNNDSTSSLSQIKFGLLVTFSIPSALCSVLILIHFYQQRNHFAIHQHLTCLLTIISFLQVTTQIPLAMAYYRRGEVIPATSAFCTWWVWWEFSLNGLSRFTMVWGSIERHLLIFNISLMATKRKRLIFHILPTLITSTYPFLFYFVAIISNTCKNRWNYRANICGAPCYIIDYSNLFIYDMIGVVVLPILVISIANTLLVVRVVHQKQRRQAAWRRQRKLTIQLLGVAFLYILFWFPMTFSAIVTVFAPSHTARQLQVNYFIFFLDMVPLLLPFTLLVTLPKLVKKLLRKQRRIIRPA